MDSTRVTFRSSFTSQPSGSTATVSPCVLVPSTTSSSCSVDFMADTAGSYTIKASYSGSPLHTASDGSDTMLVTAGPPTTVTVDPSTTSTHSHPQRCVTATETAMCANTTASVTVC